MRLLVLLLLVGCATEEDALTRAHRRAMAVTTPRTCEEGCIQRARQCRVDALDDANNAWSPLARLVDQAQASGVLQHCALSKQECMEICEIRKRGE